MGCAALRRLDHSAAYQAGEKFETKDSFLTLPKVSSIRWTDLWVPLATKSLNISIGKLPQLSEDIEKIDLPRLVYKLETVREIIPVWDDQPAGTLIWSSLAWSFVAMIIIVVVGKAVVDKE